MTKTLVNSVAYRLGYVDGLVGNLPALETFAINTHGRASYGKGHAEGNAHRADVAHDFLDKSGRWLHHDAKTAFDVSLRAAAAQFLAH